MAWAAEAAEGAAHGAVALPPHAEVPAEARALCAVHAAQAAAAHAAKAIPARHQGPSTSPIPVAARAEHADPGDGQQGFDRLPGQPGDVLLDGGHAQRGEVVARGGQADGAGTHHHRVRLQRQHHHRPLAPREIPEPRQRLPGPVHLQNQVGQKPLLLVRLGDRHLVEVDPIGLRVAGRVAELRVAPGDQVERRALLVRIEPREGTD